MSFPSRTFKGVRSEFGSKHPWALEPLKLFFGLIYIREYAFRFVLTNAQIELMAFDLPRVEYNHGKEKKGEKMTDIEMKECEDENERQMRAYVDKIKGEKISLTEYINKE